MKVLLTIMMITLLSGFLLPKAVAETSVDISNNGEGSTSEVHVENSTGESTTCVNGDCTTTQNGGSSTTVCINGNCETTQGNVDRQEGGAKVKVENNNSVGPVEGQTITLTPTLNPTKHATESAESSISAQKDEQKIQQLNLEEIFNSIRNFFSELFS